MFQLVAKIISWKTYSLDSQSVQNQEKITATEWKQYEKHLLEISKTEGTEVIKKKLITIHSQIKNNQGFA